VNYGVFEEVYEERDANNHVPIVFAKELGRRNGNVVLAWTALVRSAGHDAREENYDRNWNKAS
jgi:hypothetical protein